MTFCLWLVKWSLVTHLFEVLEGELVHWIDLRETGDDKVQDWASGGHGSVTLPCRVDHQLGGLCLLQAMLYGLWCHLRNGVKRRTKQKRKRRTATKQEQERWGRGRGSKENRIGHGRTTRKFQTQMEMIFTENDRLRQIHHLYCTEQNRTSTYLWLLESLN